MPAFRLSSFEDTVFGVETVAESGIPIAEVTLTTPGALEVIAHLACSKPELIVGAGTVLDLETARRCLDAGAKFLSSPGLDLDIVDFAVKHDIAVLPGALTPSEIMAAAKAGADLIKVYPCSLMGGPVYIRTLRAPFRGLALIAAGGVTQQTAPEFILAGATALGVGRDLVNPEAVRRRMPDWIRELTGRFLEIIAEARSRGSA
ncbi:MAG: bifunctional 4-hydroxy-2-oxoglutarate aldolase/2-dehydro-3-deoxy-phosphogluconate aldolase [Acidobacteriia bacterium]|nr:bifunctional 4-hydroxy-2-oxoglutarate aldolase/2-dehydro-3-deoxy-phosphogluconate aldolase [Terriglobia bacterium]